MLKWLPDEFMQENSALPVAGARRDQFCPAGARTGDGVFQGTGFQKESGFGDSASLLSSFSQEDRSLLFDLVEQDVKREFEDRETELKIGLEKDLAEARSDYQRQLETWAEEFGNRISLRVDEELREIGKAAALLAVQLAGKITRALVPLDPEILVRALQTTLFKVSGSQPLHLVVHPDDAVWLQERQGLLQQLNVSEVAGDRRIEPGGCLLQSGGREWDVTLAGQLEALGEIVQEAMATAGSEATHSLPEENNDPGLE